MITSFLSLHTNVVPNFIKFAIRFVNWIQSLRTRKKKLKENKQLIVLTSIVSHSNPFGSVYGSWRTLSRDGSMGPMFSSVISYNIT